MELYDWQQAVQELESQKRNIPVNEPLGLSELLNRGMGNISYVFFSVIFTYIFGQQQSAVIFVLVVFAFIIWMFGSDFMRDRMPHLEHMTSSFTWLAMTVDMIDFVSMIGLYLVVQFVLLVFMGTWANTSLEWGEIVVGIFAIIMGGFGIV